VRDGLQFALDASLQLHVLDDTYLAVDEEDDQQHNDRRREYHAQGAPVARDHDQVLLEEQLLVEHEVLEARSLDQLVALAVL